MGGTEVEKWILKQRVIRQNSSNLIKCTVTLKVLDVKYLFHLRLDFFVKEQKMSKNKWHFERLKALSDADLEETVR